MFGCLIWVGIAVVVLAIIGSFSGDDDAPKETKVAVEKTTAKVEKKQPEKKKPEIPCDTDLNCWNKKWRVDAWTYCAAEVERYPKYDYKWTNGWLEPRFSKYGWRDKSKGILTYWGDKVQFQNGFGAWVRMQYSCDFNPHTKRAKATVFRK